MTKNRPDYQIHLKYRTNAIAVDTLCERVVASGGDPGNAITVIQDICGGTVGDLDQDGLQRAYFELRLLEVRAWRTYGRVRLQPGAHYPPVPSPEALRLSLEELEQLVDCALGDGYSADTLQSILQLARADLNTEKQTLWDLDATGMEVVYKQVLRLLVNPIEFIRSHPLDFHPIT